MAKTNAGTNMMENIIVKPSPMIPLLLLFCCKITKKYLKHNDLLAKVTNF